MNTPALETVSPDTEAPASSSDIAQDTPPTTPTPEDSRQAMMATFDKLTKPEGEEEGVTPGDPPDTSEEPKSEAPEGETVTPAEDESGKALDKARHAMKRNQWTDDDLAKLSDEDILQKGGAYMKRQADLDRQYTESQKTRKELEKLMAEYGLSNPQAAGEEATESGEAPKADADDSTPTTPSSSQREAVREKVRDVIDKVVAPLKDDDMLSDLEPVLGVLGTEMSEALVDHFGRESEQQSQDMQAKLDEMQAQMDAFTVRQESETIRQVAQRPELLKEFPALQKPEVLVELEETVRDLAQRPSADVLYYDEAGALRWDVVVTDAAKLVASSPHPLKQAQARLASRQASIGNGQLAPASGVKTSQTAALSPKAAMQEIARRMGNGESGEEAARNVRSSA